MQAAIDLCAMHQDVHAGGFGFSRTPLMLACLLRMQACDLFLNATIFGWLPSIGSMLFPVHVRATGYNFGHTAAQSWLGGLTPVIISAIALRLQQSGSSAGAVSVYLVTGVYLTACAIISLIALVLMWRMFPQTNKDTAGSHVAQTPLPVTEKVNAGA